MAAVPMTTEEREERAMTRGRTLAERITQVAPGVYHCPSQTQDGEFHIVTDLAVLGVGTGLACDCRAAEVGNQCAHRAALVVARQNAQRRQLRVRPTVDARGPRRQVEL